jgi:hypothetical protein
MACLALIPPVAGLAIDRWGLRSSFLLARPDPVPEIADSLPWTDRTVRLVA